MVVYDEVIQAAELIAEPFKIIEKGKKITRRFMGVGVSYVDMEHK